MSIRFGYNSGSEESILNNKLIWNLRQKKFLAKELRISQNNTLKNSFLILGSKDKILIDNEKRKIDSKTLILFRYTDKLESYLGILVKELIQSLYMKYGSVHYFAFMITYNHDPITYKSPHEIIQLNESIYDEVDWNYAMLTGVCNNVTKYKSCKEFYKQFYDKYDKVYFYTLKKEYDDYDKFEIDKQQYTSGYNIYNFSVSCLK